MTAASGGGTIVISIAENVVMPGNHAATQNFTRVAYPSITISTTDTDIRERELVDFDIVFTEPVTAFTAGDITVTGGTRGALTANSATSYTLSVTAGVGAGMITLAIAQNVVTPGNQALSQSFTRNAHDAVDISTTDPAIYEDETFTVNITFPESVTGFAVSDITVTGGALGTLTGSGASYSIPVTAASGAGNIVVSVAQDVVNEGNAAASATFTRLGFTDTVTITAIDTDIREGETFNVDIGFSASVTGFVVGDIAVTGASINGLTGSGTDYDLSLTANSGAGTYCCLHCSERGDAG